MSKDKLCAKNLKMHGSEIAVILVNDSVERRKEIKLELANTMHICKNIVLLGSIVGSMPSVIHTCLYMHMPEWCKAGQISLSFLPLES